MQPGGSMSSHPGRGRGVSPLWGGFCLPHSSVQLAKIYPDLRLNDLLCPPPKNSPAPLGSGGEHLLSTLTLLMLAVPRRPHCSRGVHGFTEGAHPELPAEPAPCALGGEDFFSISLPSRCQMQALADQHPRQCSFLNTVKVLPASGGTSHQRLGLSNLIYYIPSPKTYTQDSCKPNLIDRCPLLVCVKCSTYVNSLELYIQRSDKHG